MRPIDADVIVRVMSKSQDDAMKDNRLSPKQKENNYKICEAIKSLIAEFPTIGNESLSYYILHKDGWV